jgi:hypothetical protein
MYKNVVLFEKKSYFYKKKDMKTTIKSPTKRTLNKSDYFELSKPVLNTVIKLKELDYWVNVSKR